MTLDATGKLVRIGLPAALLLWLALASVFGEKVQVEEGLGWDGLDYAMMARRGPADVIGDFDPYRIQRVGPPAVVHLGAKLMRWPLTTARQLLVAFGVLHVVTFAGAIAVWWCLCRHLRLGPQGRVLCFAGLFLNYAVLKMTPFMPTLGDSTALVLGLLMLHLHLTERRSWLVVTAVVGAFTYPTLLPTAVLLLMMPPLAAPAPQSPRGDAWPAYLVAGGLALVALSFHATGGLASRDDLAKVRPGWAVPIAALVAVYLALALRPLLGARLALTTLRSVRLPWLALGALLLLATRALVLAASNPELPPKLTAGGYANGVLHTALVAPLGGLVAHAVYFGPLVLVAAWRWREVCAVLRERPGLHALALVTVVLSVSTESRQLITWWPVIVTATCLALERRPLSWRATGAIVFLSLVASRCWLPLNHGPLTGDPLKFPDQWHFMTQGPWMTTTSLCINALACAAVAGVLAATGELRPHQEEAPRPDGAGP